MSQIARGDDTRSLSLERLHVAGRCHMGTRIASTQGFRLFLNIIKRPRRYLSKVPRIVYPFSYQARVKDPNEAFSIAPLSTAILEQESANVHRSPSPVDLIPPAPTNPNLSRESFALAGLFAEQRNICLSGLLTLTELSSLVTLLTIYRFSPIEGLAPFLYSAGGVAFIIAALTMLTGGFVLVWYFHRLSASFRRQAILTITMHALMVALMILSGEGTLRLLHAISMRTGVEKVNFPTLRKWEDTAARFLSAVHESSTALPYHEYDPTLGWVIGHNRSSRDGLYFSSDEGLRSPHLGARMLTWSLKDPVGLRAHPKPYRVALIGDSFTFGYEVKFEETWGHLIGREMGTDFHFVNFGVIGYGVNQVRMKYERDVRLTRPDVVIFSVISHDLLRDIFIYNFMFAPDFLPLPYARPRPILRDGRLTILNNPTPSPMEIFNTADVHKLPYLANDSNYNWIEWERSPWRLLQRSLLFRTLTSLPTGPPAARQDKFFAELKALEPYVLMSFVEAVRHDGALPILIYFPDEYELNMSTAPYRTLPAPTILRKTGLDYVDASACLTPLPSDRRFAAEGHYSPEANRALAKCLPGLILKKVHGELASLASSPE